MSEFDFNLNIIYGTYEYTRNIQRDYFNIYFIKNICQLTYMRGSIYKYIYCYSSNFTQNDLEAFPTLYFKIKELRFIFSLNYKDLFYLTEDKKYYIFNIMMINFYNYENINNDELDGVRWIFGLPFWKKYQFSFDTDNKLIYYYNKNGKFIDETIQENKDSDNDYCDSNDYWNENDTKKTNNKNTKEINGKNNYTSIEIKKIVLFIIIFLFFIFLFCILILIIKKEIS